jgi:hypothetical protein
MGERGFLERLIMGLREKRGEGIAPVGIGAGDTGFLGSRQWWRNGGIFGRRLPAVVGSRLLSTRLR